MHEYLVSYTFLRHGQQGLGSIIMTCSTPLASHDLPTAEDIIREKNHLSKDVVVVVVGIYKF